jgi:hypothetical protein
MTQTTAEVDRLRLQLSALRLELSQTRGALAVMTDERNLLANALEEIDSEHHSQLTNDTCCALYDRWEAGITPATPEFIQAQHERGLPWPPPQA